MSKQLADRHVCITHGGITELGDVDVVDGCEKLSLEGIVQLGHQIVFGQVKCILAVCLGDLDGGRDSEVGGGCWAGVLGHGEGNAVESWVGDVGDGWDGHCIVVQLLLFGVSEGLRWSVFHQPWLVRYGGGENE